MTVTELAVEVLLPVHNEAESIEATIREIYEELSARLPFQFIIAEDGSVDGTKAILARLGHSYPMKLLMSEERKGYGPAIVDGMRELQAPYLLCLDSDGQCDPRDFWRFWGCRGTSDILVGHRVNRKRGLWRKALSGAFYALYWALFRVPIHDPSFCFILARREAVERLVPELGHMREGFWWEFDARAYRRGFSVKELPVKHRDRFAGETRVYRPSKLPGIAYRHFVALFKIWYQTRS
jgi:glycosyltransferase involved in cell wall biosynthesis